MPHFRPYHTIDRPATQSWSDLNITIPPGSTGELRTTCPQCSAGRHDRNGKSLSVNLREGIWYCHYCHWKGSLTRPGSMPLLCRRCGAFTIPRVTPGHGPTSQRIDQLKRDKGVA
jgi:twinkle protein